MPRINFPYPATAGQTYTYNGVTWTYNGYAWSSTTNLSLQYVTDVGNTTTNNIGIGTTGPLLNDSYSLQIKNGSSELFNVGKNGNVGIGATASSAGRLQITNTSAMDGGQLGSELLSSSNWTSTGWSGTYPTFTHNTGNTTALANSLAATSGSYYQVDFTIAGRTAGSVVISFGGINVGQGSITVSNKIGIKASSGSLTITPTTDFDGAISISIKQVTTGIPSISIIDSGGTASNEIRAFGGASGSNTNFAMGLYAGQRIVTGNYNTFIGYQAGSNTISTDGNLGIGYQALNSNTLGSLNTAIGQSALNSNTDGYGNLAIGFASLGSNTTGNTNFGLGYATFSNLTSGSSNIAIGFNAGRYVSNGSTTLTRADNSIFIGGNTYPATGSQQNQIVIGYGATGYGAFTTTIGSTGTIKTILQGGTQIGGINGTGSLNIGPVGGSGSQSLHIGKDISSNITVVHSDGVIQNSGANAGVTNFGSFLNTAAGSYNVSYFYHFLAKQDTIGASSSVTSQTGFYVDSNVASATNNFGFRSLISSATNNWNLYMQGTAKNYLEGNTLIGTTTDGGQKLQVNGTFKTTGTNTLTDLGGTGTRIVATDNTGKLSVAYGYNFSGSISSTGTTATVNLLTITIPANSLTDYLNVRSIMFQQSGTALAGVQVKIWTGTTNVFGSATQISNYSFSAGSNLFFQISRLYSLQSGLLIGYPQTVSSATGTGSSSVAMLSITFDPTVTNYLFISAQLNDATDTATLRNVNITY